MEPSTSNQQRYLSTLICEAAANGHIDEPKEIYAPKLASEWLIQLSFDDASVCIDSLLKKNFEIANIILKKHSVL